jgi:hypothetical protein
MRDLYSENSGGAYFGLDLIYNPIINDITLPGETSASVIITVSELDMGIDPDGYGVKYQLYALDEKTPVGSLSERQIFFKSIAITGINCSGTTIVYTAANHPFVVGDYVSIEGSGLTRFNLINKKITAVSTNTFTIQRSNETVTSGNISTTAKAREDIIIKNLGSGRVYDFIIEPFKGNPTLSGSYGSSTTYYNYKTKLINPAVQSKTKPIDPTKKTPGKSYLQITNESTAKNVFQFAYKDFESIVLPTIIQEQKTVKKGTGSIQKVISTYDTTYYSFGTSMMISNAESNNGRGGGGLAFFLSNDGGKGYYIILDTAAKATDIKENELRVVKTDGKQMKVLLDTQNRITRDKTGKAISVSDDKMASTLANTQAGKIYNISVKVKASYTELIMIIDVNGFKVTVYDTPNYAEALPGVISPAKGIGLFCTSGKVMFDYVYGRKIEKEDFAKSSFDPNFYSGQFSNDYLDTSFGNLTYNQNFNSTDIDLVDKIPSAIEEFGTTAREIYKLSGKFNVLPSRPAGVSLGNNRNASVLASKYNNFEAEAYILNNSSTTIPLEDSGYNSLFIWGNEISKASEQEYTTSNETDYTYIEPVTFSSNWIQNEEDAKALANWIKQSVVNKGKVLELQVFGNPLISVGDVATVKFTYQGMVGTEKFIVTKVTQSFNQGLVTNLTCRTL